MSPAVGQPTEARAVSRHSVQSRVPLQGLKGGRWWAFQRFQAFESAAPIPGSRAFQRILSPSAAPSLWENLPPSRLFIRQPRVLRRNIRCTCRCNLRFLGPPLQDNWLPAGPPTDRGPLQPRYAHRLAKPPLPFLLLFFSPSLTVSSFCLVVIVGSR